ncbi:hypothetical protein WJX73_001046 [Symbiochloris irregularis]|uniref:Replication protein A subunit n=1 Tax=Symbiochloris irregularis TaxID=706552 RepID=A0AAW1PZJ2_9CHLO
MAVPQLQPWVWNVYNSTSSHVSGGLVCQVIGVQQMNQQGNPQGGSRYRLGLSDGQLWINAVTTTQLTELVRNNTIRDGSYLRLNDSQLESKNNRKMLILLNLDVLAHGPKFGDPARVEQATGPGGAPQGNQANGNGYHAQPHQQGPPQQNGMRTGGSYGPPQGSSAYGAPQQSNGFGANGYGASGGGSSNQYGGQNQYGAGGGGYGPPAGGGAYGAPQQQQGGYRAPGMGGGAYGAPSTPNYRAGTAPIARDEAPPRFVPIAALNAYQARWTLKARVASKSDLRRYSNARGEGKVFSFDLIDASEGEIRCTAFGDTAVKFYDQIIVGRVITLSKASVRPKKPGNNFNQTRHDHEITLENGTQIQEVADNDGASAGIPKMLYCFKRIEEVENTPPKAMIDIVGVVEMVEPWTTITKKDGTDTTKRPVTLRDQSNRSVELTLWGEYAMNPGEELEAAYKDGHKPILAIKSARVGDFNGRTLSTVSSSSIAVDPDIPEAGALRHWWDSAGGAQAVAAPLTDSSRGSGAGRADRRVFLDTIREEQLGQNGQAAFVAVNAYVGFIRGENMSYPACTLNYAGRQCNKKLTSQGDGGDSWWCERCQSNSAVEWRYMLSAQIQDHTGNNWFTAFQESAPSVMGGVSANDLKSMSQAEFDAAIFRAGFGQYCFKLKIAEDTYNDETRIKLSCMKAEPLDFAKESQMLLQYLDNLDRGLPLLSAAAPPAAANAGPSYGGGGQRSGGGYGQQMGGSAASPWKPNNNSSFGGAGMNSGGGWGGGGGNTGYGGNNSNSYGGGGGYGGNTYGGGGAGNPNNSFF